MSDNEVKRYSATDFPAEIFCQTESYIRLIFRAKARGADRFFNLKSITDPMWHFVICERDMLISHALVRQRTLNHAGETYSLYGVGAVMTHPAFRGEGYGQRVVAAATASICASSADVGMLFTYPALETFYGNCGWVHLSDPGIHYGDPANPKFENAFTMMVFVSERAKAHRADFDRGPIYVGASRW